jgi:hypothetical protein
MEVFTTDVASPRSNVALKQLIPTRHMAALLMDA